MLRCQIIGLDQFYDLAQDLIKENFLETSPTKGDHEFNLNWEMIEHTDKAGWLHIAGAFSGDELVGYALVLKVPNLLHAHIKTCILHTIYISKDYRKGRAGIRLIKFAENMARALDAEELRVAISRHSKTRQDKPLSNLFTVLGYGFKEVLYSKRV